MQTDDQRGVDRRTVLALAGGTLGAYAALASGLVDMTRAASAEPTKGVDRRRVLTLEEWRTLAAAQARLLPSDDLGPGAAEVNAIGYLDGVLADPAVSHVTKARIRDHAQKLDQYARSRRRPHFAALNAHAQDAALRTFEASAEGLRWLKSMIGFTLEAFLGDPTHGANPDGIGWTWANHTPGKPRPESPGWQPKERR